MDKSKYRYKILAVVLCILMVLELTSATLYANNETETGADIVYSDLFYGYPKYLINDTFINNYKSDIESLYDEVIQDYENSATKYGTAVSNALSLMSSSSDFVKFITDKMGITDFEYYDALDAANEKVVENLLDASIAGEMFGKTAKYAKTVSKSLESLDAFEIDFEEKYLKGQITFEEILQEGFLRIWSEGLFEWLPKSMLSSLCQNLAELEVDIAEVFGTGESVFTFIRNASVALAREELRIDIINDIINTQKTNTVLRQGMVRLRNQLQNGFVGFFVQNYIVDKAIEKVYSVIGDAVTSAVGATEIQKILGAVNHVVFEIILDVPSYGDVLAFQVLQCYSNDLSTTITETSQSFVNGPFLSDKIINYENLFTGYAAINKAAISSLTSIAKSTDEPYTEVSRLLMAAATHNISEIMIKIKEKTVKFAADTALEEIISFLEQETANGTVTVNIDNGIEEKTIPNKAIAYYKAVASGAGKSQAKIDTFNTIYGETGLGLYEKHISSVITTLKKLPVEERKLLDKEVYSKWIYLVEDTVNLKAASNTIEKNCIYAVNNTILGNLQIQEESKLVNETGQNLSIDGYISILHNATLQNDGSLDINSSIYSSAQEANIVNNNVITMDRLILGEAFTKITNKGIFSVNEDAVCTSTTVNQAKNAEFRIGGNYSGNVSNYGVPLCNIGGTIVFNGNEQQTVTNLKAENISVNNMLGIKYLSDVWVYGQYNLNGYPADYNGFCTMMFKDTILQQGNNFGNVYLKENMSLDYDVCCNVYIPEELTLTIPLGAKVNVYGYISIFKNSLLQVDGELIVNGSIYSSAQGANIVNNNVITTDRLILGEAFAKVTNNGKLTVYGDTEMTKPTIKQSENAEIFFGGKCYCDTYKYGMIDGGTIIFNGSDSQTVTNVQAPIILIQNSSDSGVIFKNNISPSILFNHNGNKFTLHNGGEGSVFQDYDTDGLKDNVDLSPTVWNASEIKVDIISLDFSKGISLKCKVDKSLFEEKGYEEPELHISINEISMISNEYIVEDRYYVFYIKIDSKEKLKCLTSVALSAKHENVEYNSQEIINTMLEYGNHDCDIDGDCYVSITDLVMIDNMHNELGNTSNVEIDPEADGILDENDIEYVRNMILLELQLKQ